MWMPRHTHTHTLILQLKCVDCIFVSLEDAWRCIFVLVSLELLFFPNLFSPALSLSLSCSPSLSQVSQAINVLFASCFCFAFVRRVFVGVCVLVSVSVFVNLFHILPVYLLALPLPLHPFHALQPPAPPPSFRPSLACARQRKSNENKRNLSQKGGLRLYLKVGPSSLLESVF